MKKNTKKETRDIQITKDKKIHEIFITKINKRKKNMKALHFIIASGEQGFEDGKEINPIEIKIENNKMQNIFDRFEKNKIRFKLSGILFASSIKNNTEKIFLQTAGLSGAKYALINEKYKQITGVINLNEIQNWPEIRNGVINLNEIQNRSEIKKNI